MNEQSGIFNILVVAVSVIAIRAIRRLKAIKIEFNVLNTEYILFYAGTYALRARSPLNEVTMDSSFPQGLTW